MTAKYCRAMATMQEIDGCMIIEVPDDYMPTKMTIVLTHEDAAAAPKYLSEYKKQVNLVQRLGRLLRSWSRAVRSIRIQQEKGALFALKTAQQLGGERLLFSGRFCLSAINEVED